MFLLLSFSGNPFFTGPEWAKTFFVVLALLLSIRHYRMFMIREAGYLLLFLTLFLLIFAFQFKILGFVSPVGIAGFLLKMVFGFIIIASVGGNFRRVYLNTIFGVSLVSLAGFAWNLTGHDIPSFYGVEDVYRNMIFFTQRFDGIRNSGMFWEPGTFACYIVLGLILYLGEIKELLACNKFRLAVILLALITTFSTTGYVVTFLFILVSLFNLKSRKYIALIIPVAVLLIMAGLSISRNSAFLGEKIKIQMQDASSNQGEFSPTRFGSLMFDIHYIKKHFLIGNGIHEKTRFADHPYLMGEDLGHGNGFSDFFASMGFLGLLFYSYFIVRLRARMKWLFLLIVYLVLQGEPLLNFPLFLSIPFIFLFDGKISGTDYVPQSPGYYPEIAGSPS
jgi:hypothetical protein